ncbi:MAG: tetratricopeptide repeat protein [Flavobacteriales bacterium]|nr:tetratricopeptide repeat protein [Flavobacteriales bacterium]MCB9448008.1 tetratricopeptide repeat protein [Flavobacteriales bacterium]
MRMILLTGGLVLAGFLQSFGQMSNVLSAYNYMQYGEWDKAKTAIDEAVTNSATAENPKAWNYRGQIYIMIMSTQETKPEVHIDDNPLDKAYESYRNTRKYDAKGRYKEDVEKGLENCRRAYFNKGAKEYNVKDYPGAFRDFSNAVDIADTLNVADTNAVYFAGVAAYNAQMYEEAVPVLKKAVNRNIKPESSWDLLSSSLLLSGDTAAWNQTVEEGLKKDPKNMRLLIQQVNYYLTKSMNNEARDKLKAAIELEPTNVVLYYNLGHVYDNLKDIPNAEKAYKKAIELKPDYLDAVYNLGAMYYNNAVAIRLAADELEGEAFEKEHVKENENLEKARTYLERAFAIDATDTNTLLSLKALYTRIGEKEKLADIEKRLE